MVAVEPDALFGRVADILDQARGNVVRAVNTQMVLAYWLIGREIVQALQGGEERAACGKSIVTGLSQRLTQRYGRAILLKCCGVSGSFTWRILRGARFSSRREEYRSPQKFPTRWVEN